MMSYFPVYLGDIWLNCPFLWNFISGNNFSDPSGRWACPLRLPAVLLAPHPSPLTRYSSVSLSPNPEHRNAQNISGCCAVLNCTGRVGVRVTKEDHDQVSYCAKKCLLHRKQTLGYPAWPDSNDVLFATDLLKP